MLHYLCFILHKMLFIIIIFLLFNKYVIINYVLKFQYQPGSLKVEGKKAILKQKHIWLNDS